MLSVAAGLLPTLQRLPFLKYSLSLWRGWAIISYDGGMLLSRRSSPCVPSALYTGLFAPQLLPNTAAEGPIYDRERAPPRATAAACAGGKVGLVGKRLLAESRRIG